MENNLIYSRLMQLADEDYKVFNNKIVNTKMAAIGVRMPQLRAFAKELAKSSSVKAYLDNAEFNFYEQVILYGLTLANTRLDSKLKLNYLDALIKHFDSWAHVDTVIPEFKFFKNNHEILQHYEYLRTSDGEFFKRTYVIILLAHFFDDNNIGNSADLLSKVPQGQFYVDMAIAWAVSVGLVKDFVTFEKMLLDKIFTKFVHNKAIQKAIESFRICSEQKNYLRTLKI